MSESNIREGDRASGADAPHISIIISTRNRAPALSRCLETVRLIRAETPWELVVVDNGSTDDTAETLRGFAQRSRVRMQIASEPVAGLSRARNAGAQAARGEILIFTDDDCYIQPDFVDQYRRIFQDPTLGFAGGRILLHDRDDYPLTINESEQEIRFSAGRPVPCGIIQGANMAFRRKAVERTGGFDTRLGSGTAFPAEDWDMITRVGVQGWSGGYFPGPTVAHHHGRKPRDAKNLIRVYNIGSGAVYLKLLTNPATRRMYSPHLLRRILGDMKFHQLKVMQQMYGAFLFFRENKNQLINKTAQAATAGAPGSYSRRW
jgi:glycosyltransferase involved in cell wall biosynthesis